MTKKWTNRFSGKLKFVFQLKSYIVVQEYQEGNLVVAVTLFFSSAMFVWLCWLLAPTKNVFSISLFRGNRCKFVQCQKQFLNIFKEKLFLLVRIYFHVPLDFAFQNINYFLGVFWRHNKSVRSGPSRRTMYQKNIQIIHDFFAVFLCMHEWREKQLPTE